MEKQLEILAGAIVNMNYSLVAVYAVVICLAIIAVFFRSYLKKSGHIIAENENFPEKLRQLQQVKSAELQEINNNFSAILEQQKKLEVETGEIKQSLNKRSISYQIKLSAYHDKSIAGIEKVYLSLIALKYAALGLGTTPNDEAKDVFRESVHGFRKEIDTQSIWISKVLADDILQVAISLENKTEQFIMANRRLELASRPGSVDLAEDKANECFTAENNFYDYINTDINEAMDALVEKISSVLNEEGCQAG